MAIDLSPAGLPSAYPANGLRFWPWLVGWVVCCGFGAATVLLLWPTGTPASGATFWLCLLGIPNAAYFMTLAIARAIYEADYLYARFRNRHRTVWLKNRIRTAQRPLQVLGAGYCLPLGVMSLGELLAGKTSLLEARSPRAGMGRVLHTRFADDDPLLQEEENEHLEVDDETAEDETADVEHTEVTELAEAPTPPAPVPPVVRVIEQALAPLVESLSALSQYGPKYAPAVRVLSAPETADQRLEQVKQALLRAGLDTLECHAVPAADGLMVVDVWLDANEQRPLLVVAAEWHDEPPPGSTEGAVAVLLGPGVFQLPEPVKVIGALHRPVMDDLEGLDAVLLNSMLWGQADAATVASAWISGLDNAHDGKLLAALRSTGLASVAKQEAQRWPDRMLGHAGTAGGWLSIAAAIEADARTQLIFHAPPTTSTVQAAILHVTDPIKHEESDDKRTQ
ncbi:hypothetical protein DIE19_19255 [Burkholderia sp. Bp9126]|nr:hypothetical protein DIE19_19255 [Burkholderia sp. Bp9126]